MFSILQHHLHNVGIRSASFWDHFGTISTSVGVEDSWTKSLNSWEAHTANPIRLDPGATMTSTINGKSDSSIHILDDVQILTRATPVRYSPILLLQQVLAEPAANKHATAILGANTKKQRPNT